jgi:hypothetical protein
MGYTLAAVAVLAALALVAGAMKLDAQLHSRSPATPGSGDELLRPAQR